MRNETTAEEPAEDAPAELVRRARALLLCDELEQALALLSPRASDDPSCALLSGVAHFRQERYREAAGEFRAAIALGGVAGVELERLLGLSRANDLCDIRRPVPERYDFDAALLGRGPQPGSACAQARPREKAVRSPLGAVTRATGELAGELFGKGLSLLTAAFGEPAGRGEGQSVFTTWYERDFARAMLMLAHRRQRLNRENLFSAYPPGRRVGFLWDASVRPAWTHWARTADGSWNDANEPMAGAAFTRFGSNTDPAQTAPETEEGTLLSPNPRTVSRRLLTRDKGFRAIPFLNLTAASWIQFMVHDWVSYGDPEKTRFYRIALDDDDPVRKRLELPYMRVFATQRDPVVRPGDRDDSHINEVTAWWDGSQIYGSDVATQAAVRSGEDGKLRLDPKTGNLPVAEDGVERTGFRRNWWVGLSMLHALFSREHNSICDMLKASHPSFDDQRLFDTARLITVAVMAKVHTVEWTPAVLPNPVLAAAMNANWYGLLTNLLRGKRSRRTVAQINIADPIVGGIVGNKTDNHGVPYSLTREFVAVYRLHSLLPDEVALCRVGEPEVSRRFSLNELRQRGAHRITDEVSMADLFYSFGIQHPGQLVLNNFPTTLQELSIPGAPFYDLGAVDVLRDRERGVPRYNAFRRLMGLTPIGRFEDLTDDADELRALAEVYDDVEQIDLLIGNLAEAHRPKGFGFGETLFEVFILNASRRLEADRFFTESYNEETYTYEGLRWIDEATFKSVLMRHHPELRATGLANIDNAFEPWDVGPLSLERHPLRAFDPELRERDARRGG